MVLGLGEACQVNLTRRRKVLPAGPPPSPAGTVGITVRLIRGGARSRRDLAAAMDGATIDAPGGRSDLSAKAPAALIPIRYA